MKYTDFYKYLLNEAIVTGEKPQLTAPLKDNDTIRVYHGFYNPLNAVEFVKYGVSGKERANRNYSFETNNNPFGLFVTPIFAVAKRFTGTHRLGKSSSGTEINLGIILEFNTRVKDLEAPVWPGGSFTVQGQMSNDWDQSQGLKSIMADREKAKTQLRQNILQSTRRNDKNFEFIKQSDRPELAATLFAMGESQALFIGDLNPNMIRAVWVFDTGINPHYGTFKRLSRQEFINKYGYLEGKSDKRRDSSDRIYLPNESWQGVDDFISRYNKKTGHKLSKKDFEFLINNKRLSSLINTLEMYLWPKQLKQAIIDLNLDPEDEYTLPQ